MKTLGSTPPALALRAVKGAGESAPLLAVFAEDAEGTNKR